MTVSDPIVLGCFAVLGASVLIVLNPAQFFGRGLSYEEAFSVCWVAFDLHGRVRDLYRTEATVGPFRSGACSGCRDGRLHIGNCGPLLGSHPGRLEERGHEIHFWSLHPHPRRGRGCLYLPLSVVHGRFEPKRE